MCYGIHNFVSYINLKLFLSNYIFLSSQDIDVSPYQFSPEKHYLSSIVLEVRFWQTLENLIYRDICQKIYTQVFIPRFFNKKNTTTDPFDN